MSYADGTTRTDVMAQLPNWALRQFLARHGGPALETAQAEATFRGWDAPSPKMPERCVECGGPHPYFDCPAA